MIGDSITRGYDGTSTATDPIYNGYRSVLDADCIAAGYTALQWKGQQNNSTASYVPTRLHEGINGDSCNDKLPTGPATNTSGNPTNHIDNYFGVGKPFHGVGVVMINLGSNAESGGGTFGANYLSLAQQIFALEPQVRFVVQTLHASASSKNPTLLPIWAQMAAAGMPTYVCAATSDPATGMQAGDLTDGLHPNPAGYTKMGHMVSRILLRCLKGL